MNIENFCALNKSIKFITDAGDKNIIPGGVILLPAILEDGKVNWKKFEEIIIESVRYLDSFIDTYKLNHNSIKLGISGLADLFMFLNIRYGSIESISLIISIMNILLMKAYETSITLGTESIDSTKNLIDSKILNFLPVTVKSKYDKFGIKHSNLIGLDVDDISDTRYSRGISPILYKAYKNKEGQYYIHPKFKNLLMLGQKKDWCIDIWDLNIEDYLNIYCIVKKYSDQMMVDYIPLTKLKNLNLKFYIKELSSIKILHDDDDDDIIKVSDGEALEYVVSKMIINIIRAEDLVDCNSEWGAAYSDLEKEVDQLREEIFTLDPSRRPVSADAAVEIQREYMDAKKRYGMALEAKIQVDEEYATAEALKEKSRMTYVFTSSRPLEQLLSLLP